MTRRLPVLELHARGPVTKFLGERSRRMLALAYRQPIPVESDVKHRPRERILTNLETIYREAYARAKEAGDKERMLDLDSSFQREQLILEVLLDVRDALLAPQDRSSSKSTLGKLQSLRRLTRLK